MHKHIFCKLKLCLFAALSCLLLSVNNIARAQIINSIVSIGPGFAGDGGPATCARITFAAGGKTDAAGNLYIADDGNCVIRRVDAVTGIITTVAGTPSSPGYSGDGGPATAAQLQYPQDVAINPITGDLYIADGYNNVIRVVIAIGGAITPASIIKTYAGVYPGPAGYAGDGGSATAAGVKLYFPTSLDIDASGKLYIAEYANQVIRVVQGGIINTYAGVGGTSGYSGDGGPATAARLRSPLSVKLDPASGKVFISDHNNNVVRVVNGGIINTYAGMASAPYGYTGDGGPATAATFNSIGHIAVSAAGDLFICDGWNNVVRSVDHATGIINTAVGAYPGTAGLSGDGGPANSPACQLYGPNGLTFDNAGNLLVFDQNGNRIRSISGLPGATTAYPTNYNACAGGSVTAQINITGGTWSTTSPNINITPSGTSCLIDALSPGTATVTYTVPCGITITDTIVVASCGPVCSDTCYWKVTGNNIIGANNRFGTLTNDDIQFITHGSFRAVMQGTGNGNLGIHTNTPTTFLDVDCTPPTVVPAPSGLRLENLPGGHGNVLVVDAAGYVYAANSIAYRPGGDAAGEICCTDLQNQINQLQQQINDLKNLLAANGISVPGTVKANSFNVSPNPSNGQVTATYSIASGFTSAAIRVTDNTGKTIVEKTVNGNSGTMDLIIPPGVASGQLYCTLFADGKILISQKLMLLNK